MSLNFKKPLTIGQKEVFNSDVFIAVGNPAVTDEGEMNAIDLNNYVKTSIAPIGNDKAFEISCCFTLNDTSASPQALFSVDNVDWYNHVLVTYNSWGYIGAVFQLKLTDDTTTTIRAETKFNLGATYKAVVLWDKTKYRVQIYENGTLKASQEYESALSLKNINTSKFMIGRSKSGSYYLRGDVYLNTFNITVDGANVLSGTKTVKAEWQNKPFKFEIDEI